MVNPIPDFPLPSTIQSVATPSTQSQSIAQIVEKFRSEHPVTSSIPLSERKVEVTSSEAEETKKFWKYIKKLVEDNPDRVLIDIPSVGKFHRAHLETLLILDPNITPSKFRSFYSTLHQKDFFKGNKGALICRYVIANRLDAMEEELRKDQVNAVDDQGKSALMWAIILGNTEAVDLLLKAGANVNQRDKNGDTPLHFATYFERVEQIEILLLLGADIDRLNSNGRAPILFAAGSHERTMLDILLKNGAKVKALTDKQEDPISYAVFNGRTENMAILVDAYNRQRMLDHTFSASAPPGFQTGPLLACLDEMRYKFTKQKIEMVQKMSSDPKKTSAYMENYRYMKLTAHAFEQSGDVQLQDKTEEMEGYRGQKCAAVMAQSWKDFATEYRQENSTYTLDVIRHLHQALQFASDQEARTPQQLLMRINRGMPVFINTGYIGHAATILIWKGFLVYCDRGGDKPRSSALTISAYDPSRMDLAIVERIVASMHRPYEEYYELIDKILPQELDLHPFVPLEAKMPFQKVGNCSWASLEGAIKGYLYVSEHLNAEEREIALEDRKLKMDRLHENWLSFQRRTLLDKYLDVEYDPMLVDSILSEMDAGPNIRMTDLAALKGKFIEKEIFALQAPLLEMAGEAIPYSMIVRLVALVRICTSLDKVDPSYERKLRQRIDEEVLVHLSILMRLVFKVERVAKQSSFQSVTAWIAVSLAIGIAANISGYMQQMALEVGQGR